MADWRTTRDEVEIVGETETGAMRPESDSGGSEQRNKCMKSLAICSLLQVVVFGGFASFFTNELTPGPLLYAGTNIALGAMGILFFCCFNSGKVMLMHIILNSVLLGLLVDPVIFSLEECFSDCVSCSANSLCPYCCASTNGQPCTCKLLNLAAFALGMSLQLVCMWHAVILYNHNNNSPPNEPENAYQRFTDPVSSVADASPVRSTSAQPSAIEEDRRKKLQQEARFAANRVFR